MTEALETGRPDYMPSGLSPARVFSERESIQRHSLGKSTLIPRAAHGRDGPLFLAAERVDGFWGRWLYVAGLSDTTRTQGSHGS